MSFTVLIADDEELERRALRHILGTIEGEAIEIVEAANGRQAIEAARERQPDLALLDIKMPGVDGIEAARELKLMSPRTRCVFVTAFESFEYAREAMRLGADEYLLKPAEPETVRETVLRAMELQRGELEEQGYRGKIDSAGEQALSLLDGELRDSLNRGGLDGTRLDRYLGLRRSEGGTRIAIAVRGTRSGRGGSQDRIATSKRVADQLERSLGQADWFCISGFDEKEIRMLCVAPGDSDIRAELEKIGEDCSTRLGIPVLIGAATLKPRDCAEPFSAAQDAANLARKDRPVVVLDHRGDGGTEDRPAEYAKGRQVVDRAIDYMRSHLAEDISLPDVSAAVRCSPYHLSRLFTAYEGDTFVSAFARMRVVAAKALLRTGDYSVKETGILVGFRDQTYFARVFRRIEGKTPTEFASEEGRR